MLQDYYYAFGLLLLPSSLKKKFFEEGDPPLHTSALPCSNIPSSPAYAVLI